ncbi:dihydroxyacetone kinase family protein [Mycetocola spongiae]|uniref:dihydroxyacetone kinase family protein n=1 Tax=Mycetocola spongiae TaxID=2859226 RepID=UPI001CF144FF|nr:dihydroxyacetone kinase family protein [Mycetocola spongiae]UCR89819.1 dihydroxyacetone kinase family protein [Mycetocola spongiae]
MTTLFNDPADFAEDQFEGFLNLYSDRLRGVPGGAVAHRERGAQPQVAVVIGGGSGHYPAFCGLVGPGFATGAVVGNIFTSPSAAHVYSVAKAADQGRGVVLSFGNYAGDNMNFGIAATRLRAEGIDVRIVVVTDDIASASEENKRRGIAGDFTVFKALGAAAARGLDLDEVERLGNLANARTRTLGVAFSGCTMPGAEHPLFGVPEGHLGLGLGIHGEPGIRDEPLPSARDLATLLVGDVLAAAPANPGNRVGVIVNGLGTTKYEELFLLWASIAPLLAEAGLEVVDAEVGELVTSLDMGGCSLTLLWLDDELEPLWRADAYAPAYRKQAAPVAALIIPEPGAIAEADSVEIPAASAASLALAPAAVGALATVSTTLHTHEVRLGEIDAVAGDGDHGRGMVKGIDAALVAARAAAEAGGGVAYVIRAAGRAWAEFAGGTSGVLWGAALEGFAAALGDDREHYGAAELAAAVTGFESAILELGGARPGDKTLVDALVPFAAELRSRITAGEPAGAAWVAAAQVATAAAADTAPLRPRLGRARPLAEKSVGTPDAGATSLALIVTDLARTAGTENN